MLTALGAAPAASAKEGAQARLLGPVPADARPGALITLRWTVTIPGPHGGRVPFGAGGMFAKLIGRNGATTTAAATQTHAPFSVRIRVPAGGIHTVKLGLHGFAVESSGTHPAPIFFPIRQAKTSSVVQPAGISTVR